MNKKFLSTGILIIIIAMLTGCSFAGHYYKEGKKSFEDGKYEKAAENFNKAIELNSNRADYFIDYGMTLIALGKYEDALSQFDSAYMNKEMSIIRENNKRVLRGKGIAYYKMQKYEQAVTAFNKALNMSELPGLNLDILYYMGSALTSIGSYDKAIDTYTKIIAKDKKNAGAYGDRASCYRYMGMTEKSMEDYDKAISIDTTNYEYYFGKYDLLAESGKEVDAKNVLSNATEIEAKTEEDKYNLAKIHYYQGDYDLALTELEKSYKNGFNEADYYIGEVYRNKKDYTKAVYYYEEYINSGKVNRSNVYNQAAVCLFKVDDYKKAIKYLELGIKYNDAGTIQTLKKNEIIAYENLGDFNKADEKLKDYLGSYPEDKDAIREAEFIETRLTTVNEEENNE